MAGIFNVASAGNSGAKGCGQILHPPAENEHSFVVAALGLRSEERAWFSSLGPGRFRSPAIDVSVAGERILRAQIGNRYRYSSGTSFASPVVAGGALLVMAACPGLVRDVDGVARLLRSATTPLPAKLGCGGEAINNESGHGLLNLRLAIALCQAETVENIK